jgi:quercetin dioxygenase-like cupin family protein
MNAVSFAEEMRVLGHPVSEWSNGPGYSYASHSHPDQKILLGLEGSIVFHVNDHDIRLYAGDRTVIEARVEHSATVGASGARCAEAHVS